MNSPFPGMDPYLEAHWGDVHARLVTYASDQLARQMPPHLKVRIEEYVAVEIDDEPRDPLYVPDIRVIERTQTATAGTQAAWSDSATGTLTAADEPVLVPRVVEPLTQREIRIIDLREGGRLVTAIEVLSETNKNKGREDYRTKQRELIEAGANLVEIDLLRSGYWVLAVDPESVPPTHRGPYRVCVVRATYPSRAEPYRASYTATLPNVRIPLRTQDSDATLHLQSLVAQVYANGQYDDLDYRHDPNPPLTPEESQYIDDWLKREGRR